MYSRLNKLTEAEKVLYHLIKPLGLNLIFQRYLYSHSRYPIDFQLYVTRDQISILKAKKWPVSFANIRLCLEITGPYHDPKKAFLFQRRQEALNSSSGLTVHFLRCSEEEAVYRTEEVRERLYAKCKELWGIELQYEDVRYYLKENEEVRGWPR